ncbi:MAG TPA: cupin domain-containing protein [Dehalococcoidia bacterium]|nr:cupin domain-containing protein [Dehalococcoidia bacterium]
MRDVSNDSELQTYYRQMVPHALRPLWLDYKELLQPEPRSKAIPYVWHWRDMYPQIMKAAELVSTDEAERRVLMLMNPGLEGRDAITNTLYAGVQLVLPGEVAAAHRHTPSALRFIIDGDGGGHTTVDGERIPMESGDLVLTPNWTWHDHGNHSGRPIIWLDGLDLPLANMLEATFFELFGDDMQPVTKPSDASVESWGAAAGLRPVGRQHTAAYSPLMHYQWRQTKPALERLAAAGGGTPEDGAMLEYTNPQTGGHVMPTMACYAQVLAPGQRTAAHRHTCSAVYQVVEGRGQSIVNGEQLDWESKDVFCVPGWAYHEHANTSSEPAYLFSFTDLPVLESMDLLREQPHPKGRQ